MKISEKIRHCFGKNVCSLSRLTLKQTFSRRTLYRVKNGEVTTKTAGRLAKILGVDITDLIETTED
ncbi:MAG: helix-turn-helix domain-containing protein [Oscillospiraceae bacterium]